MEKYTIAPAGLQDIESLKRIELESGLSPWTEEAYKSEIERAGGVVLVARTEDGAIVGFLAGRKPVGEGDVAEIYNIGTLVNLRREKIGSMLFETFRELCLVAGGKVIWLEVRSKNHAAKEFYRSHGFVTTGTRPDFYSGPPDDAELMSLPLI